VAFTCKVVSTVVDLATVTFGFYNMYHFKP